MEVPFESRGLGSTPDYARGFEGFETWVGSRRVGQVSMFIKKESVF